MHQLLVRELLEGGLEGVDLLDALPVGLEEAVVAAAEYDFEGGL